MKLSDFLAEMEVIAPRALALDFDNPGLLVSPDSDTLDKVLLALDCTPAVVREAAEWGAQLVLTHHPLFFGGTKHLTKDDPETVAAWLLARHGIGMFAAHTNLDAAPGGVNEQLLAKVGLTDIRPMPGESCGRLGTLPEPLPLGDFVRLVDDKLGSKAFFTGDPAAVVTTVGCVSGTGGYCAPHAKAQGADVFLTGEMKHHEALAAEICGIPSVVAGHYETEHIVLEPLRNRLQILNSDVQYRLALSDIAPFKREA